MPGTPFDLLGLLFVTSAFGFVVLAVISMTSFVKIAVVLFLLRNALGIQQTPPNVVLYTIALALTVFISQPLIHEVYRVMSTEGADYRDFADYVEVARRASEPLAQHLVKFTRPAEREFFAEATLSLWPADVRAATDPSDLSILIPSFLMSELRRAFEIGFLLYLPFVTIDLVVTTILMAMGMSQVTPNTIAIPFKIFLFVVVEGWTRLIQGLVLSYR